MNTKNATWYNSSDDETIERLQSTFLFAKENKHSDFYSYLPETSSDSALDELSKMVSMEIPSTKSTLPGCYDEREVHYVMSGFDTRDESSYTLIPIHLSKKWESVMEHVKNSGTVSAGIMTPVSWQISIPFYRTCRQAQLPIVLLPERNVPVAAMVLNEANVSFVSATPKNANLLFERLVSIGNATQIAHWQLIVPHTYDEDTPQLSGNISIEAHLFPGIPIGTLIQVEKLPSVTRYALAPSDDYLFEVSNEHCFITSLTHEAFPLFKYELSGAAKVLEHEGQSTIVFS